jgi:branched-subunit amino acid ABC-type transport system permease component
MIDAIVQGVLLGGYYAVLAAGLSLMFGVMRIINLAHGDLAILGAYGVLALTSAGLPWWGAALLVLPVMALVGALLFALFDAFQLRLQTVVEGVPYQLFLMAPYVLSILALILVARRARVPEALMQPYRRGER